MTTIDPAVAGDGHSAQQCHAPDVESHPRRSGGPRTPEGKARSRRNALKHGLTGAGAVLPPALEAEVEAEREDLAGALRPTDAVESRLVEQAALASVRMRHLAAAEQARTAQRCRDARRDWELRRSEQVLDWAAK